jgi:hypothetical protein
MAKLSVVIGADDRELQAALRRAQSGMVKLGGEMRDGINTSVKYGAAMVAAGGAIAVAMVKQSLDAIDAQAKLAQQMNTTVTSMATVERAAELDGVAFEQLQAAAKALNVNLGEAAQGTGQAAKSIERLGLSVSALTSMPLDQRISTINEAIRENIPLSQQAAVAADFFGAKAGAAMLMLSPDTMHRAAEEAKLFGTALSEIDAKKIEAANDSFSRVSLGMEGFWKQISVKVAPVLDELGQRFTQVVEEAGGMEAIASRAFDNLVVSVGFAMDAVDGLKRTFVILGNSIVVAFAAAESATARFNLQVSKMGVGRFINKDFDKFVEEREAKISELGSVVDQAIAKINETLEAPMPSEGLQRFVKDATDAANAAAEAAVSARPTAPTDEEGGSGNPELQKKLEKMREQFASEDELLFERREKELEDIRAFEDAKLITAEEGALLREEAEQAHWDRIGEIHAKASQSAIALEKAKNDALKRAQENFMGNMAGLMNTESRKVFEIGKAAAVGQAAYKGGLAVMDAWEAGMSTGGPWAPVVAAAYATAAGLNSANLINNIRKQQFGGSGTTPTAPTQGSSGITGGGAMGGGGSGGGGGGPTSIIHLNGDTFGRDQVRALLERLNEEGTNGGRVIFA